MAKNNIKTGKIFLNVCAIIAVVLMIVSCIIDYIYIQNMKNNLQESSKLLFEMGAYKFSTPDISVYLIISGVFILFIGGIVSSIMCKCKNCGKTVISSYGTLYEYCPKCGKRIDNK